MPRIAALACLLLAAAPASAARYANSAAVQGRLDKIDEATRAIDANLQAMRRQQEAVRGTKAEGSLDTTIAGLEAARRSLQGERGSLVAEKARLEKREREPRAGEASPLDGADKRPAPGPAPAPDGVPPGTPAGSPGGAAPGGSAPASEPAADAPDIPAAPTPGEAGFPGSTGGDGPDASSGGASSADGTVDAAGAAAAERSAKAGGERSGAAAARAAKLGAQLGGDLRAPEGLDGAGKAGSAQARPGTAAAPGPAASAGAGGSPSPAAGPAGGAGLGGAMETLGLKVGRDSEGRAAILRRDGTPASPRELALVRADSTGVLPYATHQELLGIHASRADLRETDLKHVDAPEEEKDFRWSKSCDKVSGECNKHAGKGSYKRGEHVAAEDLADIWKAIKTAAGVGARRKGYDGSSHFRRMRAMLGAEADDEDAGGPDGAAPGGNRDDGSPPAPGEEADGVAAAPRPGTGAPPPAPRSGLARRVRKAVEGRPLWPALLISAVVGGGLLWKFRRDED